MLFFVAPDTSGWAESARYADPITRVQGRFPAFRFALMGEPIGHGEFVRFRWTFGPPGAEPPIEMEEDKIGRVIGFLDRLPQ